PIINRDEFAALQNFGRSAPPHLRLRTYLHCESIRQNIEQIIFNLHWHIGSRKPPPDEPVSFPADTPLKPRPLSGIPPEPMYRHRIQQFIGKNDPANTFQVWSGELRRAIQEWSGDGLVPEMLLWKKEFRGRGRPRSFARVF